MGNLFDDAQNIAFDIVTKTMGYAATWTPSTGGSQQNANVLFKNPTAKYALDGQAEYNPNRYIMEYKMGDLNGLVTNVNQSIVETVNVNAVDYYVRDVTAKYDGKTLIAILEPLV
jgi:hypothetical protein